MNTSKSLDDILKELIVASGGGYWYSYADKIEIQELAEAKAAIVEAVEGLIGEDIDVSALMTGKQRDERLMAMGENKLRKQLLQAIKETKGI